MKKYVKKVSRGLAPAATATATRVPPKKPVGLKSAVGPAPAAGGSARKRLPEKRAAPTTPATSAATPPSVSPEGKALADLTDEVRGLRATVAALVTPAKPAAEDASLEESVDALRRLLSELLEKRLEGLAAHIVTARAALDKPATVPLAAETLDRILGDLGVTAFCAERLEWVDPLIHIVAGEREDEDAPDSVVLETIRPGYRTARGTVIAKASVVVSRRT